MKKSINLAVIMFLLLALSFDVYANQNNIKSINIKSPYIKQEIRGFKNKIIGIDGLHSVFASKNNFVFLHCGGLLAFKSSEPNEIYSFINLQKIHSYCIQGDVVTDFFIDNSCKYAIINNNYCYTTTKNDEPNMGMYFCNLSKSSTKKISIRNAYNITTSWSSNSRYFAFYDKVAKELMLFDTNHETLKKICNYKDNVDRILVQNNGDILLNSVNHKIYNINNKGSIHKVNQGSLICSSSKGFIYFDKAKIYEHKTKDKLICNIGKGFKLIFIDKNQAIFSKNKVTKVFNKSSKKLFIFTQKYDYYMLFSPDSKKYLYTKTNNSKKFKVVYYNGKTTEVDDPYYSNLYNGHYLWADDNSLISASLQPKQNTPDYFKILKINVLTNIETTYQTVSQ